MKESVRTWLRFSIINLAIVALLGVVMRYKIAFDFPFFDQKYIQHSHSHFAFAGWVSQAIMVLMVHRLGLSATLNYRRYRWVFIANLIASYGMLATFLIGGYWWLSIFFSTASIFVSYAFAWLFWRDLAGNKTARTAWYKAALVFSVLSSVGTFALAAMMATKHIRQDLYLGAIYFYLHFQYNGWFFFACMGLLADYLCGKAVTVGFRLCFRLLAFSCVPAYLLSILWAGLPWWLYGIACVAAVVQLAAWGTLLRNLWRITISPGPTVLRYIVNFTGFALLLKFALQLASAHPSLGTLAFGFRPIVIAYLHLVLLAIISLFLLWYAFAEKIVTISRWSVISLGVFAAAVIANETILASQGLAAFSYTPIPYSNELLLVAAIVLFISAAGLSYFCFARKRPL